MTRIVSSASRSGRLAAWVAVGVALTAGAQARAEPLVSGFGQGRGAVFAVAADRPTPVAQRPRVRPRRGAQLQELRAALVRAHGAELVTLFFGYYGAFLPPPATPTVPPTIPTPDPLPPVVLGAGSTPPLQMPPSPPPLQMPASLPGFLPPPQTAPPSQTPEPATLLSGLVGAGLAGLAAWRKRRRKKQEMA